MGNTNKNGILKSKFVWAKGEQETMNCNLVFSTEIHAERKQNIRVQISAFNLYKLYINGKFVTFGPARSAKGYFRVDKKTCAYKKGIMKYPFWFQHITWRIFLTLKTSRFLLLRVRLIKKCILQPILSVLTLIIGLKMHKDIVIKGVLPNITYRTKTLLSG